MATIDLGKIKLVWRGTYAGGTAYTVDDVVQHTDSGITSSFICTTASTGNAPSTGGTVHGSWAYLAKGAAGSVLTTQGDILYRDGSGDQRLAKGSAAQVLTMNSGATAPEWAASADGGKVLQWTNNHITTQYSNSSATYADFSGLQEFAITPSASTSKIAILAQFSGACKNWNILKFQRKIGSGSYADFALPSSASGSQSNGHFGGFYDTDDGIFMQVSWNYLDTPSTTDEVKYKLRGLSHNPNTIYLNRTHGNHNYASNGNTTSSVMLLEIGA